MTRLFARMSMLLGVVALVISIIILAVTFWPVTKHELSYALNQNQPLATNITPIDPDFSVIIKKINANAKVIPNIDPNNPKQYQYALTKGIAHALNSSFPDKPGNMFLFAHSSVDFYQALQYNSIFYLLSKLEKGDQIDVYYHNTPYTYTVVSTKKVPPTAVEYLHPTSPEKTLTLMTCWPPGTTLQRLLVVATQNGQ